MEYVAHKKSRERAVQLENLRVSLAKIPTGCVSYIDNCIM